MVKSVIQPGMIVNGYKVESVLGEGGMATVYRANQISLNRPVALKVLHQKFSRRPDFLARFERESGTLAQVQHPNIVSVIDRGVWNECYYFVMEFVDGSDLDVLLSQYDFDMKQITKIINDVGQGMASVHELGMVHRDMKPANILIGKSGVIKVSDFGIASIAQGDEKVKHITGEGAAMGTGVYMAPEQMADARNVDQRADVYALGATFYKLLTRKLPTGRFPAPSEVNSQIPKAVDQVILGAMDSDPARRPQDVRTLCRDLLQALQNRDQKSLQSAPRMDAGSVALRELREAPGSQARKGGKKKKKGKQSFNPVVLILAVVGAVIAVGVGAWVMLQPKGTEASGTVEVSTPTPEPTMAPSPEPTLEAPTAPPPTPIPYVDHLPVATPGPSTGAMRGGDQGRRGPQPSDMDMSDAALYGLAPETVPMGGDPALQGTAPPPAQIISTLPGMVATPAVFAVPTPDASIVVGPTPTPAPVATATPVPPAPATLRNLDGMVRLGGATAAYGNDADPLASPAQRGFLGAFFLDLHEVSNANWADFVRIAGARPPDYWGGSTPPEDMMLLPVHQISQQEAAAYAAWVGKRLPTEQEWEFAMTSASASGRGAGGAPAQFTYYRDGVNVGTGRLLPVNAEGDATPTGVRHGVGNVAEWTSSVFRMYDGARVRFPDGKGRYASIRGASALDFTLEAPPGGEALRASWRAYADPSARIPGVGFRCARDLGRSN